jgi:hypothetical protein
MVPASMERALDAALDRAVGMQRGVVTSYGDRLRTRPGATPESVIRDLERRYLGLVTVIGAASGGVAAVPGVGTAASVGAGVAEVAAFVEATALFTLAVAEVHRLRFDDPDARRALILGVVLGDVGGTAIEAASIAGAQWAPLLSRSVNRESIGHLNQALLRRLVTRYGTRQGALVLGRALPFGIGAGIGAVGNAALGRASVRAARRAFGPAPATFGPRIIDV